MHVRRCLSLLLSLLLSVLALWAWAGAAAPPAVAGGATGYVSDRFGNPLTQVLIEGLDSVSGVTVAEATTDGTGAYSLTVDTTPSGTYKIRASDPAGIFTTIYLWDSLSFDTAYVFGCT